MLDVIDAGRSSASVFAKHQPKRWIVACLALIPAALTGCDGLTKPEVGTTLPPSSSTASTPSNNTATYSSYTAAVNRFSEELNSSLFSNDPNNYVVPAGIGFQVGSILLPHNQYVGVCAVPAEAFQNPDPPVEWQPTDNASTTFSASASLPAAIAKVLTINGSVKVGESVSLDFEGLSTHYAGLAQFQQVLETNQCGTVINSELASGTITVIRGTISGTESFNFQHAPSISLGASIGSLANFNIAGQTGTSPVSLAEKSPSVHFLVLYTIKAPEAILASAPVVQSPAAPTPTSPANPGDASSPAGATATPTIAAAIAASDTASPADVRPPAAVISGIVGTIPLQGLATHE